MDLAFPEPNKLISQLKNEMDDNVRWQMAVELGRVAREQNDGMAWFMGDLAVSVMDRWGNDSLEEYAGEVGVKRNTLLRYALVSRAFPPDKRDAKLSHRHHLILASRTDRFELLDKIKDREDVSSENLVRLLKKADGKLDEDIASIRVLLSAGDIQKTMRWYSLIEKELDGRLTEDDHILAERYRMNLAKLKHIVKNGHSEDL